jgi:tRNA (pseudouridine54-N1)-methyltransferase
MFASSGSRSSARARVKTRTEPVRRFVLIGQTASASGEYSLDDLPSSSGRLDALVRALRAALLVSHDVRRDVEAYLVLRGGPAAPRVLRVAGARAKFLRPDERSLATLLKKTLTAAPRPLAELTEVRPGVDLLDGDLSDLLPRDDSAPLYVLDEAGADLRSRSLASDDGWFFLGDHTGFEPATRELLARRGATPVSVGPRSLHAEDVVTLVNNELDRRFVVT